MQAVILVLLAALLGAAARAATADQRLCSKVDAASLAQAAAAALIGDARLTASDAKFSGSCDALGLSPLNNTSPGGGAAGLEPPFSGPAVVLSIGAAGRVGRGRTTAARLPSPGATAIDGFDTASLEFLVHVAPAATAGLELLQLSLQFAFATQEGARPVAAPWRGRPRPDTAAIVILPTEGNASAAPAHRAAGAAAAGHANVAFLPSGAAVDASAVLAQRRASSDQALVHDSNGWVITT
ncbi:hypothetical protein MNEG_8179, partial [Monoraphidium neglectum]